MRTKTKVGILAGTASAVLLGFGVITTQPTTQTATPTPKPKSSLTSFAWAYWDINQEICRLDGPSVKIVGIQNDGKDRFCGTQVFYGAGTPPTPTPTKK